MRIGGERIPVAEVYSLVIDNPATTLSVSAVNALTEKQYAAMLLLVGERTKDEIFLETKEILEL